MITKEFDQELYDKYDGPGKAVAKKYIESNFKGLTVELHPDEYDIDLIIMRGDERIAYLEVEKRESWDTHNFPFYDLNVPERKKKFLKKELPVYFISVNNNETALFLGMGEAILKCPLKPNPNPKGPKGERFFKVPLDILNLVDLR
jgi:hypothetical protein